MRTHPNWRSRLSNVAIRDERPGDEDGIRSLTTEAFAGAPHSSGRESLIVDALRSAAALSVSLVAEHESQIVGHVAISPVTIAGVTGGWFGLGPVSVAPSLQDQGIGAEMIEAALTRLKADGAAGCVLLGDPAYYGRFGFVADSKLTYPGPPPEYFQCLILRGPAASGEVRYHRAFGAD